MLRNTGNKPADLILTATCVPNTGTAQSPDKEALSILLQRFEDHSHISITDANKALPRRLGFRSNQEAVCRVFDLAAQHHAGVREGSPHQAYKLAVDVVQHWSSVQAASEPAAVHAFINHHANGSMWNAFNDRLRQTRPSGSRPASSRCWRRRTIGSCLCGVESNHVARGRKNLEGSSSPQPWARTRAPIAGFANTTLVVRGKM